MSNEASPLGPIDATSLSIREDEQEAPWIVRKLVGSMTGRIVVSSFESLRAAGTTVVCLSPWGDTSPLVLPCIRFRDIAFHTVVVATGGMAAVAAPAMLPVTQAAVATFGSSVLVKLGVSTGFSLTTKFANDLVFSRPINALVPIHSARLETTGTKELTITLEVKLVGEDAALGFFRGSVHRDLSLFSSFTDYISVEKGWFSPYLFASERRPVIPRSMKPDVIFCHGPFLDGDYSVGTTLLDESASEIVFCEASPVPDAPVVEKEEEEEESFLEKLSLPDLTNLFDRSRSPSPTPALLPLPAPPAPRRMVILIVGLKPFRTTWAGSKRPEESVLRYTLLNGCPSIVVPVKVGAPLVAWDTMTLEQLWTMKIPAEDGGKSEDGRFEGVVDVLLEYLDLCIDWARVNSEDGSAPAPLTDGGKPRPAAAAASAGAPVSLEAKKEAVKDAITLLVASAIRAKESKQVQDEVDEHRAGIAMWRIP